MTPRFLETFKKKSYNLTIVAHTVAQADSCQPLLGKWFAGSSRE